MRLKLWKLCFWSLGLFSCFSVAASEGKKKKVVFVIVDGIAFDMLSKTPTPFMDKIAAQGNLFEAYIGGKKDTYSQTPTISAVGYNSLLTGTWVNKHNVKDNGIEAPNYNYPTLFRLAKNSRPELKMAIFSTWLDNRTKLVGEGLEETKNIMLDYAFDGLELDKQKYPHDAQSEYIKEIDNAVVHRAAEYIGKYAPDISWVYLQFTDDMGHRHGDSKELYEAITYEDALIGKLYEAVQLREAHFEEDWLFVVTTDHGRTVENGKHHGGQSDRERSIWILTNEKNWKANTANFMPSIVDISPSILDHMDVEIPITVRSEWDGNSMYKEVKIANLTGTMKGTTLNLNWDHTLGAVKEQAEVWGVATNKKNTGGTDDYTLLGKIDLSKGKANLKIQNKGVEFYKVYLKSEVGNLNTWIFVNK